MQIDSRYELLACEILEGNRRLILGDRKDPQCRYCKKRSPEVQFRNIAHAFPQLIGNRWVFDEWECDSCNALFDRMLENDLGKYLLPVLIFSRIRGRDGVRKYQDKNGGTRIEMKDDVLQICNENNDVAIDEDGNGFTLRVTLQPYTPIGVFKCFVKMALSVMPDAEFKLCEHLIQWISEENHSNGSHQFHSLLIFTQLITSDMPNDYISYSLQRRKEGVAGVPFMQFSILIHNTNYQLFLPMPLQDGDSRITEMTYPNNLGWSEIVLGKEDFSSPKVVRDDVRTIRFGLPGKLT